MSGRPNNSNFCKAFVYNELIIICDLYNNPVLILAVLVLIIGAGPATDEMLYYYTGWQVNRMPSTL